ncbi:hypothetical protein BC629DRAFT_1590242 [Irpex lacteus]|nr:hypothetical protein BC629DRAFT_1590242 [Irpex lacteus]
MVLETPIVASQIPPPAAPTVELDTVIADTPVANDDDSSQAATQPEVTLVQRMWLTTFGTLFTIIFIGCLSAFKLSVAVVRAMLAGVLVMSSLAQLAQLIPEPLGITVAQTVNSYSTPFLPLLWAFMRTALIGAATCGAYTGVVFGVVCAFYFVPRPAEGPPLSCQLRKTCTELKSSKCSQIACFITHIVIGSAVMAAGIFVQTYHNSAGDNLKVDEVIKYPLRAMAVTLAGHVVECGLQYLRALYNLSAKGEGDRDAETLVQISVDEKSEVSVDSDSVLAAVDVKEGDSPV